MRACLVSCDLDGCVAACVASYVYATTTTAKAGLTLFNFKFKKKIYPLSEASTSTRTRSQPGSPKNVESKVEHELKRPRRDEPAASLT